MIEDQITIEVYQYQLNNRIEEKQIPDQALQNCIWWFDELVTRCCMGVKKNDKLLLDQNFRRENAYKRSYKRIHNNYIHMDFILPRNEFVSAGGKFDLFNELRSFLDSCQCFGHKLLDAEKIIYNMNLSEYCETKEYIEYFTALHEIFSKILNEYHNMKIVICLLYTSPSPRDRTRSRMPSSA